MYVYIDLSYIYEYICIYVYTQIIVQREEERLHRNNFSKILQDDSMHRAFLAICFEMVCDICIYV